jgi:hypothetical protein
MPIRLHLLQVLHRTLPAAVNASDSCGSFSNSATPIPIGGHSLNTGAFAGGVAGGIAASRVDGLHTGDLYLYPLLPVPVTRTGY